MPAPTITWRSRSRSKSFLARLRALTRRGRTRHLNAVLSCGPVELDLRDRVVKVDGVDVPMTATEFRLLWYLLRRAGGLVTRDELARHVWGDELNGESNVIDVYIGYLRKKLKPSGSLVRTVRRVGYTLKEGHA